MSDGLICPRVDLDGITPLLGRGSLDGVAVGSAVAVPGSAVVGSAVAVVGSAVGIIERTDRGRSSDPSQSLNATPSGARRL